jgi:glycerol-3-phosphate dehydrogenase
LSRRFYPVYRLSSDIEAEVRYAVRHEYAQTAVDVIARRTRLSFLNAQAALNALPRVVDIMAQELNWSLSRKRRELQHATSFLTSMGLPPGAKVPEIEPHGLLEKAESALWWVISGGSIVTTGPGKVQSVMYSRAQFEAGEIDMLRAAFGQKAAIVSPVDVARGTEGKNLVRLRRENVQALLKELPGYESVHPKDLEYVLEEAGLGKIVDMDFDEFVEVRARASYLLCLGLICLSRRSVGA